jgi:hypothetical protein
VGVPRESSVQVQPKVANIVWSGDRNVVKEDRRAGLTTECGGEVGTLGPIHLNSPMPAPALNGGKVVLKGLGNGVWVRVTSEDASIVSKGS